eukprot:3182917-Rhodomonas_salina.2
MIDQIWDALATSRSAQPESRYCHRDDRAAISFSFQVPTRGKVAQAGVVAQALSEPVARFVSVTSIVASLGPGLPVAPRLSLRPPRLNAILRDHWQSLGAPWL